MSIKLWNFAPTCSKIFLLCRTSWPLTFEMSCAVLSLQQQLAPQTSSCSCHNKAGANRCCPREGKRQSRRDSQARCYSRCLQCSSVVGQLQENQISWLPSLFFLSTLSPASIPSTGSDWMECGALPQNIFSNCCPMSPVPNWSMPLSGQLRLWLGEPGMSSRTCLGPALTVRCNRD